ncbi:MAG: hypothetical protein OQK46_00735 [Gammaproteobacteria bacterium]|nr:hypothetical protein [Gammaproteobacteria bacterium]
MSEAVDIRHPKQRPMPIGLERFDGVKRWLSPLIFEYSETTIKIISLERVALVTYN